MATKAGRIQFKDIKQGRVFYKVLADFNPDGTPKIIKVDPIYVSSKPKKVKVQLESEPQHGSLPQEFDYVLFGAIPRPNHHNQFFAEYRKYSPVASKLMRIFDLHKSQELTIPGLYSPIFVNKRAADRFIKAFMLRRASEQELKRVMLRFQDNSI